MILWILDTDQQIPVKITFGFNDNENDYGCMLYHRNRLIKAYERVGFQKQVRIPTVYMKSSMSITCLIHFCCFEKNQMKVRILKEMH
jgi:hypothetical protein